MSRTLRLLIGGGVLLVLIAGGGVTLYMRNAGGHQPSHQAANASPSPAGHKAFASAPPNQPINPAGSQLVISKININAAIENVGVDQNNNMAVPTKPMDVGLYSPGPQPGQPGDAVIDGHLDWYNLPQAVFYNLGQLQPGDEIDIVAGGHTIRYAVTDRAIYSYTDHPVGLFSKGGPSRLSLITCAGAWDKGKSTYTQRLVVNAAYVGTT